MTIYHEAAHILTTHSEQSGSLKSRIYNNNLNTNVKDDKNKLFRAGNTKKSKHDRARLYALIMETLKYQDILNEVIKNSGILKLEKRVVSVCSAIDNPTSSSSFQQHHQTCLS